MQGGRSGIQSDRKFATAVTGEFALELFQRGTQDEIAAVDRSCDDRRDFIVQLSVLQREVQERDLLLLPIDDTRNCPYG
jgi:hypothetical protein